MRRAHALVFSAVVLLLALLGGGGVLTAQDSAPADYSEHPLIGSWMIDPEPENPENPVEMATFFPNGTMIDSAADGINGHGLWQPTGDTTAIVTFYMVFEDGYQLVIRSDAEIASDGQSFTGSYTNEFLDPTGESSGEIGPGVVEARRLELQAPGTPVASFEEFFGTPEGTPAT